MGRLNVMTAWSKAHPRKSIALGILVLLVIDWVIVDRWGIKGSVSDAMTGHLVADAWVLAEFGGEEPLINIPYGPHPTYRTGKCMGVRLTRTDDLGRFRLDALTFNRSLANKSAYVTVFKPGWLTSANDSEIASSLWIPSPRVRITLKRGPGERQNRRRYEPGTPQAKLPIQENIYSEELFDTVYMAVQSASSCGHEGLPVAKVAIAHAIQIAETYDERERTHSACLYAMDATVAAKQKWPFDCESLPFKNPVSAEVLAVEAEVVADRRMRLEKYSKEKGRSLP